MTAKSDDMKGSDFQQVPFLPMTMEYNTYVDFINNNLKELIRLSILATYNREIRFYEKGGGYPTLINMNLNGRCRLVDVERVFIADNKGVSYAGRERENGEYIETYLDFAVPLSFISILRAIEKRNAVTI